MRKIKRYVLEICPIMMFAGLLLLILQPLFADRLALNADCGQAGAWATFYKYGSIGIVGLWIACLLMSRRVVHQLPDVATLVVMGCVIWESLVALNQLYGDEISNHALYPFTGTFLNPGPFCGFIAIGVPLAIHYLVTIDKLQVTKKTATGDEQRVTSFPSGWYLLLITRSLSLVAFTTLILCLLLLPAGMSRSAWIASIIGGVSVYGMHKRETYKTLCMTFFKSSKGVVMTCATIVALTFLGRALFHLKEDSANGRLHIWNISCRAIAERPWTGHGRGSFPAIYAETQESYFANGMGTANEIQVAGTPEYAFNEYLYTAVEHGIPILLIMLMVGTITIGCAFRQRDYGIAGALLTVAVFAFSSYPFQLPDLLSVVILLVAVPIAKEISIYEERKIRYLLLPLIIVACMGTLYIGIKEAQIWEERHNAATEWRQVRNLYHMEAYEVASRDYATLYEKMKWNYNYLFEYGHALQKSGKYERSDSILQEAEQMCGDPMILNLRGKNHQAQGKYDEATIFYQRAYNRLPNRLYPLYLEMEMYASPECNRINKAKIIARKILDTKEKIPSKAIEEMKERASMVWDSL